MSNEILFFKEHFNYTIIDSIEIHKKIIVENLRLDVISKISNLMKNSEIERFPVHDYYFFFVPKSDSATEQRKKINEMKKIFGLDENAEKLSSGFFSYIYSGLYKKICDDLFKNNIISVIVEGGPKTLNYFLMENLWDEARIFIGEKEFSNGIKAPEIELKNSLFKKQIKNEIFCNFRHFKRFRFSRRRFHPSGECQISWRLQFRRIQFRIFVVFKRLRLECKMHQKILSRKIKKKRPHDAHNPKYTALIYIYIYIYIYVYPYNI